MTSDKTAIILLAGGKSSRFQESNGENAVKDKLLMLINDKTLLEYVCNELLDLGEVFIITTGKDRYRTYSALFNGKEWNKRVNVLTENRETAIGPIGGIFDALNHCKNYQTKIILPADLPYIDKAVIAHLIAITRENADRDLVLLIHPNGQVEHLVIATTGNNLLNIAGEIVARGIQRVSSLIRAVSSKLFVNTIQITGNNVFADIDYSSTLQPTKSIKGMKPVVATKEVSFNKKDDPSKLYTEQLREIDENNLSNALKLLKSEAEVYSNKGMLSLALHCLIDASKISNDTSLESRIDSLKNRLRD